ncbi:MAG TPA: methyltransferase domain-containing protein [Planctomycetota bacterium]|nr:methyltransferase domain-containing protein [Planctomycetota bacterium]
MNQKAAVVEHFDRFAADDRWSSLYDEIRDPLAAHSFLMRKRRVEELSEPLVGQGSKVLDVGCGTGLSAPFYIEKGCRYQGVDIAAKMIEQARTKVCGRGLCPPREAGEEAGRGGPAHNGTAVFAIGDVEAGLAFPDGHFDLVIGLGLLEYLDRLDAALDEMVRVTRPGGSLILTVPNRNCVNYFATRALGPVVSSAWWLVKRLLRRPIEKHGVYHRRFTAARFAQWLADRGCAKTGQAYYNLEALFYPLHRICPRLAYALKRRVERRHEGWMHVLATGYILRCQKGGGEEGGAGA